MSMTPAEDLEYERDLAYVHLYEMWDKDPAEFDNYHQFTVDLMEDETFIDILKQMKTDLIGPRFAQVLNEFIWKLACNKAEYGTYYPPHQ